MKLKTFASLILITLAALLLPAAHAQTYTVLHNFTGGVDGGYPYAGVTIKDRTLYGTTAYGGSSFGIDGNGTVYQVKSLGSKWSTTPVLIFQTAGGQAPFARVVFGPDGQLYGTTANGGNSIYSGVVFSLTPPPRTLAAAIYWPWSETLVHQFQDFPDGAQPIGGDLTWDQQGNIYGTTSRGGQNLLGTVYELTPSDNGYTANVLYSFQDSSESLIRSGVIVDHNRNLFGTAVGGFFSDHGKVYELSYTPGVGWVKTDIYNFQNGTDGGGPAGGLVMDNAGNLYGATWIGGSGNGGTIFELSPTGNTWTFKLLYSLSGPSGENCGPHQSLTIDAAGNLYGTTYCDGATSYGSVFKLANTANGWVYTTLHDFAVNDDGGANPNSQVTIDTDGTLYGTTSIGGPGRYGGVWMIKP